MIKLLMTCCLYACTLSTFAQAGPVESQLFYTGDGYVAAGKTETLSSSAGFQFLASPYNTRSSVQITVDNFVSNPGGPFTHFSLWLTVGPGSELHIGKYENVDLAPFRSPGLSFAGNNRGVSSVYGSNFEILAIGYDAQGAVSTLAADFTQFDEGGFLGTTSGSLRYRSDIPIAAVPEPTSVLLLLIGIVVITARVRGLRSVAFLFYARQRKDASKGGMTVVGAA
jgi:hypothetical protein